MSSATPTFGEGNGIPLQYFCLENPMDGGAWKAAVHGVAEGRTQLSDFTLTFHFHALEKEMATHSSVLAWRIPGTGEPGGLLSMGSHRVGHDWSDLAAAIPTFLWFPFARNTFFHPLAFSWSVSLDLKWVLCVCVCMCTQSCLTLCSPVDYSLSGSSVHGFSQARILEWAAISFSRGSSQPRDRTCISCVCGWVLYQLSHLVDSIYMGLVFLHPFIQSVTFDCSI